MSNAKQFLNQYLLASLWNQMFFFTFRNFALSSLTGHRQIWQLYWPWKGATVLVNFCWSNSWTVVWILMKNKHLLFSQLFFSKFFLITCLLFKRTLNDQAGPDEINACPNCGRNVNKNKPQKFVTLHTEPDQIKVC